jgi:hypothetical protein
VSAPLVEQIADAVLYEGYLLYPYRSTAVKNRQRWNFGVICPRPHSDGQGEGEPFEMETQCLVEGGAQTSLMVKVRCLRLIERTVGYLAHPLPEVPDLDDAAFVPTPSIDIDGYIFESWQEAAKCEMELPVLRLGELSGRSDRLQFSFPATRSIEPVRDAAARVAGLIVRTQEPLECSVETSLERVRTDLFRIFVRISNVTPLGRATAPCREELLARSLLSAHTILHVRDGQFVSLLEPPVEFQTAVSACRNSGTWPVLAGEAGDRHTLLSSPIILYDYPQVAPESPGDLFDCAEIDEILALRILTLTEEEKSAMRRTDERARRILERTETLPPEHFMKLHGALRSLNPAPKEGP